MATKFFIYCSKYSLEASMLHGGIGDKSGDCLQTVTLEVSMKKEFNVPFFIARLSLQTFTYALLKIQAIIVCFRRSLCKMCEAL